MCGLVAAGKTTVARRLAEELPAVRLSRDEWMLRLYGGRYDDPLYVERLGPCTELLWDIALAIVAAGSNVVLDWNFWSRERRAEARERAHHVGVELVVHWVDVDVAEAVARADVRGRERRLDAHDVGEPGIRHSALIFEPPTAAERIAITRHR
jgi:predicted kinase